MFPESAKRVLEKSPATVTVEELDRAVEQVDDAVSAAADRARAKQIEADEARDGFNELRKHRDDLDAYRALVLRLRGLPVEPASDDGDSTAGSADERRTARKGEKRQAILYLLAFGGERHIDDIGKALIERGVMTADERDWHSLQVALSRMYRKGELSRPRTAVYRLPITEDVEVG